jgi:hypothetical protein
MQCNQICGRNVQCRIASSECDDSGVYPTSGPVMIECGTFKIGCGGVGRRPEGLVDPSREGARDLVAGWLAENAHLEAASIVAFDRLRGELEALGAPRRLVRAAARSARDEVRHARVMTKLARRRGAEPAPVRVRPRARRRSLEAFALENAVEGCVRETFGALVAVRQARAARDPELRAAMERIAEDETRHAALAWSIAKWIAPRLDAAGRARVAAAMRGALASLACEARRVDEALAREVGMAHGAQATAMVDAFAAAIADAAA